MRRRRALFMLFGAALAVLALEAALQIGAWVIWADRATVSTADERCVLCVGDSFTYGLGATGDAGSYPRQLEALLRARGDGAAVVNGGWPGQSSREVLLRLPQQLARHNPRRVCILVGTNDPWARPARVRDQELSTVADEGFHWRLRLPQVFAMMTNWLRGGAGPPAFVGTWHAGDLEVTFEADGRVVMGKDELRWLADERGVTLVLPSGGVQPMQWQVQARRLTVTTPSFSHTLDAGPAAAPGPLARADKAMARGAWEEAKPLLLQALAEPPHAVAARERLVRIAVAQDDVATRDRLIEELRRDYAASGAASVGAALAQALAAAGSAGAAIDVAERVLRAVPDDVRTWDLLLSQAAASGQRVRVFACMQEVLAAAAGDEPWRPALLQMRANLRRHEQPASALHDLFAAFLQNGDRAFLVRQIELGAADYTPAVRQEVLDQMAPEPRQRVQSALADDGGESGVLANLRVHLEHMVELCRRRGAQVFLLSYPEPEPARDALVAGVAATTGATYVSLQPRFAELLRATPRNDLFIADGHCTDRGYGVMAAVVASAMR